MQRSSGMSPRLAGGLLLLAGCLAPRPGDEQPTISAAEVGRMVTEGAVPVTGELSESADEPAGGDVLPLDAERAAELMEADDFDDYEEFDDFREDPYLRFGERIRVEERDGVELITKPYPLPIGKAQAMISLIEVLKPFDYRVDIIDQSFREAYQVPTAGQAALLVLEKWDTENFTDPSKGPAAMAEPKPIALSDLLVATARYEDLEQVEDFINLFAAGVRQIEIEAKIVEVVETDLTDIGVDMGLINFPEGVFVDSLGFSLPNATSSNEALLTLGAIQDGTSFNAVLEALESFGNVSIDQKPKVAVREGASASITSTEEIPFYVVSNFKNTDSSVSANLTFKPVGTELHVTPRVVGTNTLALDVQIIASQVVGTVVTFVGDDGDPIESPQIAVRTAKTVVYLKPGEALIIGGLTSERSTSQVSRVPILGQIPILGLLFQSKRDTTETSYSMFVISPRIIQSNEFNAQL
ncbi:MAG: hypothetical protein AAF682_26230 [Planctomycetota bacterium]